ncbi:hypothetical protein BDR26DRAFT_864571 [Obelidium mucronatum]|nr:hypothetical protein BDR26DRAFT_864571 [Obelidium mucronatum]
MATTYLTAYLGNYFPSISALTTSGESKQIRSSAPYPTKHYSSTADTQKHEFQYQQQQQHQQQNLQKAAPAAQYNNHPATANFGKYSADAYHQTHQPIQNYHIPTPPIQPFQNTYQIPPVMLARFEAFEDTSAFNCMDEYAPEIEMFMREMEITTLPNVTSIDAIQTEVSWKHRKSLILWLVEVHSEYDLRPETLYLTINYIDRVCAKRVVKKSEYQLLGLTCLWIAAKFEENHGRVPSPKTLSMLLESSVLPSQFAVMEKAILSDLGFVLGHPTPEAFLKSQCKQLNNVKPPVRALARLIMELTLIHRRFRPFRPSLLAMASLILADSLHTCRFWTHSEPLLGRIISNLEECLIQAPRQILEKYRSGKFLNISLHVRSMLDNKANYLHQARLTAVPQIPTDSQPGPGLITPPKDASPFKNPWALDSFPQQRNQLPLIPTPNHHHYAAQSTPIYQQQQQQQQQQYVHNQQPLPVSSFHLPAPSQQYYNPHHQQQQLQQLQQQHPYPPQIIYKNIVPSNAILYHPHMPQNYPMQVRNFSEVSSRSGTIGSVCDMQQ